MRNFSDKLALIIVTLWVGALWTVGGLVAPVLFHDIPDRHLAGAVAGQLFTFVAYISMASAFYLLIHRVIRFGAQTLKQAFFWATFVILMLTLAGYFGIQPLLVAIKAQALPADVMQSVFADRFRTWHGIASIGYYMECLLGLVLVLRAR